jgi:hypothetical protein
MGGFRAISCLFLKMSTCKIVLVPAHRNWGGSASFLIGRWATVCREWILWEINMGVGHMGDGHMGVSESHGRWSHGSQWVTWESVSHMGDGHMGVSESHGSQSHGSQWVTWESVSHMGVSESRGSQSHGSLTVTWESVTWESVLKDTWSSWRWGHILRSLPCRHHRPLLHSHTWCLWLGLEELWSRKKEEIEFVQSIF